MLLEKNGINMLTQCRVTTNLCFVKTTVSARYNKAKCNKMRYAYILKIGTSFIFKYLLTHLWNSFWINTGFFILKFYLFLAALGLCCCKQAFLSCSKGLLSSCVWASPCSGFSCCKAQALGAQTSVVVALRLLSTGSVVVAHGLIAPWHAESSQTRDQNCVPCIGRHILNHWTGREVHYRILEVTHIHNL